MKYWFLLVVLLFTSPLFAHPHHKAQEQKPGEPPPAPPVIQDYKATIADYEESLLNAGKWVEGFDKPEFFKDLKIAKGEEPAKAFSELSDFEKSLLYLWQGERISNQLLQLHGYWKDELKKFPADDKSANYDPSKKLDEATLKKEALKGDVERYNNLVGELRKKHAQKFESIVASTFDKYKKEIPESERKAYLKRIQDWHDKQNLVDRSK